MNECVGGTQPVRFFSFRWVVISIRCDAVRVPVSGFARVVRRFVRRWIVRPYARHPRRTRARTVRGRKSRDATPRTSRSIGTDRISGTRCKSPLRTRGNEGTKERTNDAVHRDATRYRSVVRRPSSVVRRPSSVPCRTSRITIHPSNRCRVLTRRTEEGTVSRGVGTRPRV